MKSKIKEINLEKFLKARELIIEECTNIQSNLLSSNNKRKHLSFLEDSTEKLNVCLIEYQDDLLENQKKWVAEIVGIIDLLKIEFQNIAQVDKKIVDYIFKYLEISMLGNETFKLLDANSQSENIFSIIFPKLCEDLNENRRIQVWVLINKLYLEIKRFENENTYEPKTIKLVDELKGIFQYEKINEEKKEDLNVILDMLEEKLEYYKWIKYHLLRIQFKQADIDVWMIDDDLL